MKYRKKPLVIEAYQYTQGGDNPRPDWFQDRVTSNVIITHPERFIAQTPEGIMVGELNDWCILGVKGEVYPCKPDIFALTYEPVGDDA
jgi:hypothetical protein